MSKPFNCKPSKIKIPPPASADFLSSGPNSPPPPPLDFLCCFFSGCGGTPAPALSWLPSVIDLLFYPLDLAGEATARAYTKTLEIGYNACSLARRKSIDGCSMVINGAVGVVGDIMYKVLDSHNDEKIQVFITWHDL